MKMAWVEVNLNGWYLVAFYMGLLVSIGVVAITRVT